jgi:hypothetical protein
MELTMETIVAQWQSALRTDAGLRERLELLNPEGFPATRKGDLLCIKVAEKTPLVVHWDGVEIHIAQREARNPFCFWTMQGREFDRLFLEDFPPLLPAMNNSQVNITMGVDHHNGSLVLSFMVRLQECMIGGRSK